MEKTERDHTGAATPGPGSLHGHFPSQLPSSQRAAGLASARTSRPGPVRSALPHVCLSQRPGGDKHTAVSLRCPALSPAALLTAVRREKQKQSCWGGACLAFEVFVLMSDRGI